MNLYDQLIQRRVNKGIGKVVEKTGLNAYDNGINVATICLITGESEKKIKFILKKTAGSTDPAVLLQVSILLPVLS